MANSYRNPRPDLRIKIEDSNFENEQRISPSSEYSEYEGNQKMFRNVSNSTFENFELQNQVYEMKSVVNDISIKN